MNWFERLTGFSEETYTQTKAAMSVVDGHLNARGRDRGFAVSTLTLPSLADLRSEASAVSGAGRPRRSASEGDIRAMHREPENRNAGFPARVGSRSPPPSSRMASRSLTCAPVRSPQHSWPISRGRGGSPFWPSFSTWPYWRRG